VWGLRGSGRLLLLLVALCLLPRPAAAIPAFARKYQTSCETCHTVFPRLNSFGEAFRRDGFRFPEADDEMVKQQVVSLGSEAYKRVFPKAVWPGTLPGQVPLALAVNGGLTVHPDPGAGATLADDGAAVVMNELVQGASLYAGGSFDPHTTFFAELAVGPATGSDGLSGGGGLAGGVGVSIESALLLFNDLLGPDHALNLVVGRGIPTTTSFGPHSSYLADLAVPSLASSALYGRAPDAAWAFAATDNLVELNGLVAGRLDWSAGIEQGVSARIRSPQDVYLHLGARLGGPRLDGESGAVAQAGKPGAEDALTIDLVGAHSASQGSDGSVDTALALGGSLRARVRRLELDAGLRRESHDDVDGAGLSALVLGQYDELSWRLLPWLVPALRADLTMVQPADGSGSLSDLRLTPGVAALVRANLKLTLAGSVERAQGAPPSGWGPALGSALPASSSAVAGPELESIHLGLTYAY